ncbi:MAG: MarR family transcriptional regulator [Peptococcaceae bacterium]|nr:MarR family transcriptional regulator [Peptococcaceae bacterium]
MWDHLFDAYACDTEHQKQAIFTSLFVLQNRMQTAGDKLQTEISMKQWLLLAMVECCPPPRTLTRIGMLMGCSRQNVKKLAQALERKGFVRLESSTNNAVEVVFTEPARRYTAESEARHAQALALLFADFSEDDITMLFQLYRKLYAGMDRVERYVQEDV